MYKPSQRSYFRRALPQLAIASALLFLLTACGGGSQKAGEQTNIIIKGSDTEVNLALSLAEAYMDKDSTVSISVTGGGSGIGIAALINGTTDIANSSRPMKEEEVQLAEDRGVNPVPIIFALDALAVIVNENLPVDSLTSDQIGKIYTGETSNWRELGGPDRAISLYGRQSNSGTFVYFRDSIVQGEYSNNLKQMNGTAQIVEAIKTDEAGIGYVGVGYILDKNRKVSEGIKPLKVSSAAGEPAVSPAIKENVTSGAYPIVRPLFQFTDGVPTGKMRNFIDFCLTPRGQEIVGNSGYYPILPRHRQINEQTLEANAGQTTE